MMTVLNPYDWGFHEDPYPIYRSLRDDHPLYYNPELKFYALSRHQDVHDAFKDFETFSNKDGVALEATGANIAKVFFILAMDPPRHNAVRGLIRKVFTPRRVAELEPAVRSLCQQCIRQFPDSGEVDFIEAFAGRVPMDLISEMIGVPESDRRDICNWANALMERVDGSAASPESSIGASANLLGYFDAMVKDRRKGSTADDLTTAVMNAELDGERLSDQDVVAFLFLMSVAGNETTTKLLANALYWGARNRSEFAKVQADLTRVPDWVEETLRYDNSSQIVYRTVMKDVSYYGQTVPTGSRIALLIGSANRDDRVFPDPDVYTIDRDCKDTLAFGKGVHFCLGAALARMEGAACLSELFSTFRDYHVDMDSLKRVHSGNVRGFSQMKVKFTR